VPAGSIDVPDHVFQAGSVVRGDGGQRHPDDKSLLDFMARMIKLAPNYHTGGIIHQNGHSRGSGKAKLNVHNP
jgi:hypothetical protein